MERKMDISSAEQADSMAERAKAMRLSQALARFLPDDRADQLSLAAENPDGRSAWDVVLDCLTDSHVLKLNRWLRFPDRRALPVVIDEILVRQEYHVPLDREAPRIIDCGSNFGLGVYYFCRIFKSPSIVAVEPDPRVRALLEENVRTNKYSGVDVLPAAVSADPAQASFFLSDTDSLASTLLPERRGSESRKITVETVNLADLIGDGADLVKLDIEGAEATVLEASQHALSRVRYLICECHADVEAQPSILLRCLAAIEQMGFETHVTRTAWMEEKVRFRPMDRIGHGQSHMIFARHRDETSPG
jgi:FkbM family methyltransferase